MNNKNNNINTNSNIKGGIAMNNFSQNSDNTKNNKGGSNMNNYSIQTTTVNLPANISRTISVFPDMQIPSSITVYTDPATGLDVLVRNEDGEGLITCVKDNEFLVVSSYDPDAPSAISAIFGKDSVSSESHLHFELDKTQRLLERGDATVLFYLAEITNRYGYSSNEILKAFDSLTEIDIDQDTLFRALERSSTDEELKEIFFLIESGDALKLKEYINYLNDVPTYDRNYLDSTYDADNNDDMDDDSDEYDGYSDGDSYEDYSDDD